VREKGTVLALAVCDASPDPKIENKEPGVSGIAWKLAPLAMPPGAITGVVCADAKAAKTISDKVQVRMNKSIPAPTIGHEPRRNNARVVKVL
jgi:hypothetical protein